MCVCEFLNGESQYFTRGSRFFSERPLQALVSFISSFLIIK